MVFKTVKFKWTGVIQKMFSEVKDIVEFNTLLAIQTPMSNLTYILMIATYN